MVMVEGAIPKLDSNYVTKYTAIHLNCLTNSKITSTVHWANWNTKENTNISAFTKND